MERPATAEEQADAALVHLMCDDPALWRTVDAACARMILGRELFRADDAVVDLSPLYRYLVAIGAVRTSAARCVVRLAEILQDLDFAPRCPEEARALAGRRGKRRLHPACAVPAVRRRRDDELPALNLMRLALGYGA